MATTAAAVSEVAAQAGVIHIEPAALVKHYAQRMLDASDATAIHNFDLCSWDAGELALGDEQLECSGLSKPLEVLALSARIDPTRGNGLTQIWIHPAAVNVRWPRWEDH